ncbi:hypothetical protein [Pedobacter sp. L105]|uniref:beta strand repeat-containing protein n=1 Tax=Pedobacter sp. L105 TaxID=1641871 RepID=UPI00131E0615|nr:hypothetical protein [Pedobacter sp. L105]
MEIVRKIILTADDVFILSNFEAGGLGTLIIQQDAVGGHNMLLPNDARYNGFITTDTTANAVTIVKWIVYDSGVYVYTEGAGFNIVSAPGANGSTFYTWYKYADTPTTGMSDSPTGKAYMGIGYNKLSPTPSTVYSDYLWILIKGATGASGLDGRDGIDGLDGATGSPGANGLQFHVAYADSLDGSVNFNQTGGAFIGTYTDQIVADSTNYLDYQWQQLRGADGKDGTDGIAGVGADGKTSYLHIKYSNDAGVTFTANVGETVGSYIGQYVDFILADSTNPALYSWAQIKGDKGDTGATGAVGNEGLQGRQGPAITFSGLWSASKQYTEQTDFQTVVSYDNVYYATLLGSASIPLGTVPTNGTYWLALNSYANVATDILLAQDAYIGKLESNNLYLGDGVSGWVITQGSIKSLQTNSNGTATTSLTSDGRLFATNVDLTGNINASTGSIGGILVNANGISAQNFSIDQYGIANFTNAIISGTINATSGSIGGFTFSDSTTGLNGNKIVIDTNIGATVKNGGVIDARGGDMMIPLSLPTNLQNGSMWIGDSLTGSTSGGSGGSTTLAGLVDVMLSSPANGQALVYNGTKWVNQAIITDLSNYNNKAQDAAAYLGIGATATNSTALNGVTASFTAGTGIDAPIVMLNGVLRYGTAALFNAFLGINNGSTLSNNISGNAGSATTWNGNTYSGSGAGSNLLYVMGYNSSTGTWNPFTATTVQTFLNVNNGTTLTNSINGNAATSTAASYVISPDGSRDASTFLPNANPNRVRFDFVNAGSVGAGGNGNYAGVMTYSPWVGTTVSTGDGSYQLAFGNSSANGGGVPYMHLRSGIDSTWNTWYSLWHTGNFSPGNYLPLAGGTLTGSLYANGQVVSSSYVQGNRGIFGYDAGSAGTVGASNWFHSSGATGWYNDTYGGGIYMTDTSYVRVYNGKGFYSAGNVYTDSQYVSSSAAYGYKSQNYHGMVGDYDQNTTQDKIVWTIGDQWNTIAAHYGLGYSYNSSLMSSIHQVVLRQAGTTNIALGMNGDITAVGSYLGKGLIAAAADGTSSDPYGVMSVTRGANGNNYSYFGMTRAGQIGWGNGIDTSNRMIWGSGSASAGVIPTTVMSLDAAGNFGVSGSISTPKITVASSLIIPTGAPASPVNGNIWIQ